MTILRFSISSRNLYVTYKILPNMSDRPIYTLLKSPNRAKKYRIVTPEGRTIDFGAYGYQDFTTHKDESRKQRYIARHKKRENWTSKGINTAGFWSYHLLWNKETIPLAVGDIESKYNITINSSKI